MASHTAFLRTPCLIALRGAHDAAAFGRVAVTLDSHHFEVPMTRSRIINEAELRALITSVPSYCATTTFLLSGKAYTATQLVASCSAVLDASTAMSAVKATMKAALLAEEATLAGDGEVVREAREVLAVMFHGMPETLSALAIQPRKKPKPLSAEARAAATAKAKATRTARGTSSKKQKALISGNVTGVNITPVVAPTAAPVVAPGGATATATTHS